MTYFYLGDNSAQPLLDLYNMSDSYKSSSYKPSGLIEEVVHEDLINTLAFFYYVYGAGLPFLSEERVEELMGDRRGFQASNKWTDHFDSEGEFLTYLKKLSDFRDTILNSLLFRLVKNGVPVEEATEALWNLKETYGISSMDWQYRQITSE